ncbi:MAG: ATP-binding protein [Alteromonas sp.]|nr:ATP-binding protein [Alteromonas sp.]
MYKEIHDILSKTPGLKGREIAKKLDVPKKEVNSYLYKNLDKFEVDDSNNWSNLSKGHFELEFPSDKWVTIKDFENLIQELKECPPQEIKSVFFAIPSKCKILLIVTSRFLSLLNQLALREVDVTIDFTACEDTQTFFNRNGFYDFLHHSVKVLPEKPKESLAEKFQGNSDTLVELGQIEPSGRNKQLIVKLGECFVHHSSKEYELAAKTFFSELIGNVSEHSESPLQGFAGMQKYKGNHPHIQTVVSDSGKGVAATLRTTLRKFHPDLYKKYAKPTTSNDISLVREAFIKGEVSRYGKGRGLGFKSSREQAIKTFVKISIRQSTYSIELVYRDGELVRDYVIKDLCLLDGTHFCFDFYVD